jgi:UDP:flavonoid glycosyltransferase YjiC (YdhE family)
VTRSSPGRFLFVLWDGGGTVPPELALARRVAAAGHQVRILAPRSLQTKVEDAGCSFLPYRRSPDRDPRQPTAKGKAGSPAATVIAASGPYADDVKEALGAMPADVVAADYVLFGASVAAESAGVPCAALVPTVYPLPAPGLPPFGSGFSPARGLAGRTRDAVVGSILRRLWNLNLRGVNTTRRRLGLPPVRSVEDQVLRAQRVLILSSRAFDFPTTLPANAAYCGPQLDDVEWLPSWRAPWPEGDSLPLALVSLSTTYQAQDELIKRLLLAVGDTPVRVLVTLGPALSPDQFQPPPNVVLAPFVPHVHVLPRTTLAITHGGHGTVLGALAFGVPLVCIPMGRDQGDVAARVVWRGVGVRVSRNAKPEALRAAIVEVLGNDRYRAAAQAIATGIAQERGTTRAVQELEALLPGSQ